MARVSENDVLEIAPNLSTPLTAYITAASLVVDQMVSACMSGSSTEVQFEVERWLSAHMATVAQTAGTGGGALTSEKFENSEKSYGSTSGMTGYLSTNYGIQADLLSGGCLQRIGKPKAKINFLDGNG